ncbi:hypothetical protein [Spiroplasma alleghenense]|uniref:Uncharacterized protein n=1 Tax=Spiroplasma alleghenense TaxID=216931 RepID=A0A345Z3B1_9MOLU|nr:hypothetical protein [Spiroplasma alleghenense]AXK51090.1 hypothetical protein SALLE_v1c04160 [Spiroplasma alleghenense]
MRQKARSLQNQVFADNLIKQIQFKEAYFAFKFNKFKKWKLSPGRKIERMWKKSQLKKIPIKDLEIQEIYMIGFANSQYHNLKRFLRNNMNATFVNTAISRVDYFNCCMSNIWFEKYFKKFKKIKENLIEISNQPELLFYPYYLKFLTAVRESILKNMSEFVIPSVTSFTLMDAKKSINVSEEIRRSKNLIKIAFSNVKNDSEKSFNTINQEITNLYFKVSENYSDKEAQNQILTEINVKTVFQKEFGKFQFKKACKFLKISPRIKVESAYLKYQDRLTSSEVADLLVGNTKKTDDLKKAWQIYIKYRNENSI